MAQTAGSHLNEYLPGTWAVLDLPQLDLFSGATSLAILLFIQ